MNISLEQHHSLLQRQWFWKVDVKKTEQQQQQQTNQQWKIRHPGKLEKHGNRSELWSPLPFSTNYSVGNHYTAIHKVAVTCCMLSVWTTASAEPPNGKKKRCLFLQCVTLQRLLTIAAPLSATHTHRHTHAHSHMLTYHLITSHFLWGERAEDR